MKISVITVVYNNEKTIESAITSVLAQTYLNVEYIIVDGGSKDDTNKIIQKYLHHNIKYISEKDNGIYDAINKGIMLSTGDVVGILNSDDFFADEGVLNRVANGFERDISLQAVYSDIAFVSSKDHSKIGRYYSSKKFKKWMFRFGFQPAHPTFYVKRETFERLGYYRTDIKISGDFELLLRFIWINKIKVAYIDDLWVKMRVGGVSTSGFKSTIKLNKEVLDALKINDIKSVYLLLYLKYVIKWWGFVFKK
jgi:glycosyltransferase involved in cell wall biosynthesis